MLLALKNLPEVTMAFTISNKCTACGSCTAECPADAILEGNPYKIDPDECTDCGACADVCPSDAISQA
jgi:ferredoxin